MVKVNTQFVQGGYGITLEGADQVLKALKATAPDLDKALKKKFKDTGNQIIRLAKTKVPDESPLSRWGREPKDPAAWAIKSRAAERGLRVRPGGFPTYDAAKIRRGLVANTGKPRGAKFGALLYLQNKDAAGAIFEVAGRKSSGRARTGGPNFIKVLNDYDSASRVIWDAYDEMGRNKIQQELIDAVNDAEAELNRRFGGDGFTEQRR